MVTNLITGTDFSAITVDTAQTAVGDGNAFMQALQQEIATEITPTEIGTDNGALFTTDVVEKISELIEAAAQWIQQDSGTSDAKMRILQKIMELLGEKSEESDDEDEETAVGSLMQIINSMIAQIKAENDEADEVVLPTTVTEEPVQAATSLAEGENAQQLPVTAQQPEQTASAQMPPSDVQTEQALTAEPVQSEPKAAVYAEIPVPETEEQPNVIAVPARREETAESPAETVEKDSREIPTISFTVPQPQAQEQTQILQETSTEPPADVISSVSEAPLQSANFSQPIPTRTADFYAYELQSQTPTEQPVVDNEAVLETAQNVLDELLQLAKDNLGLESATLTTKTEPQQPMFFVHSFIKPQSTTTTEELEQLISQAQTAQGEVKTETELAVKMPQELTEATQQTQNEQTSQALQTAQIAQTAQTSQAETVSEQPIEIDRVPQEILSRIEVTEDGDTTLTMKLNPEELGEIEVKVSSRQGKISIEIVAQSKQTQTILAEKLDNLQTALQQNGVELEKYQVIYAPEQNQNSRQHYDGSSKNPYVRQDDESESDPDGEFAELLEAAEQI